jgi:hypothetical protein
MATSSGTITALNGVVMAPTDGEAVVAFSVSGTWTATLAIQGSADGINFYTIPGYSSAFQLTSSSFSVNDTVIANCSGFLWVQIIATAFTSGTVSVAWNNSNAGSFHLSVQPISGTVSLSTESIEIGKVDQGTPGISPWPVSLTSTTITGTVAATQSGTWTVQQGSAPWSVSQSGAWTTGRTWTLASGTDSVSAVQSGAWNITNITGTVSLPTGASTAANQATEIADLASIIANQTNGTQNVSIGTSAGKALVLKTGTLVTTAVTANQVVLTYTVTAGKTLYLEYLHMDGYETTQPGNVNPIALGTISFQVAGVSSISVPYFHSDNRMAIFNFSEPLPVAAGVVIRIVVTPVTATSITWVGNFGGYEK